jgi:hypothetical protein
MHFKKMAFACAMLASVTSTIAQPAAATDEATPKPAKEKKICRRGDAPTGSILGASVTCHTKSEWDKIDAANSRNVDTLVTRTRELQTNPMLGHQ